MADMSNPWTKILLTSPASQTTEKNGDNAALDKPRNVSISSESGGSVLTGSSRINSALSTPSSATTMTIPEVKHQQFQDKSNAIQVAIPRGLEFQKDPNSGKVYGRYDKNRTLAAKMARYAPRSSGKLGHANSLRAPNQNNGSDEAGRIVEKRNEAEPKRSDEGHGNLSTETPAAQNKVASTYTHESAGKNSIKFRPNKYSNTIPSTKTEPKISNMSGQKNHRPTVAIPKANLTKRGPAISPSKANPAKRQPEITESSPPKHLSHLDKTSTPVSTPLKAQETPVVKTETSDATVEANPKISEATNAAVSDAQPKPTKRNRGNGKGKKTTQTTSTDAKHQAILKDAWPAPKPAANENELVRSSKANSKTTANRRRSPLYFLPDEILTMILRHCLGSPLEGGIPVDPMFDPSPAHSRCRLDYRVIHACRRFYDLGIALMYEINTWAVDLRPFMECPKLYEPWPIGYGIDIGMRHIRDLVLMNDEDGTGQWHCAIQCLQGFLRHGGRVLEDGKHIKLRRLTFDVRNRGRLGLQDWVTRPAPQRVMNTLKEAGLLGNGVFSEGVWVAAGSARDMERQAALPHGGFGGLCIQLEESLKIWREMESKPVIPLEKMLTGPRVSG